MTGNEVIGGDAAATSAGYGSAGEQPERQVLPKGLLPPGRVWAQCLRAVRIRQASSPLAPNLRDFQPLKNRPVLFRREIRFCSVADKNRFFC